MGCVGGWVVACLPVELFCLGVYCDLQDLFIYVLVMFSLDLDRMWVGQAIELYKVTVSVLLVGNQKAN